MSVELFETTQMQWIVMLIAVDVALGIVAAVVKKDFKFGHVAKFMKSGVIRYVLGYAVLVLAGQALPQLAMVVQVSFYLIAVAMVASILRNLAKLGLPLPGGKWM